MPGLLPTFDRGPLTFAAHENIPGGSVVMPAAAGRIQRAGVNSVLWLGVALGDAAAYTYAPADSLDPWGNSIANMDALVPNEVAVAFQGVFKLKVALATAAVNFGDLVKCAALGEIQVHSQGGAATLGMVVGRCVEPLGIVACARGKIRLGGF